MKQKTSKSNIAHKIASNTIRDGQFNFRNYELEKKESE